MRKSLMLICAYFVLIAHSFAAVGIPDDPAWTPIGFGGGGSYTSVIFDNTTPGKMYVSSDVTDPWSSDNYGVNWEKMPNTGWRLDFTGYMVQSPVDDQTLWAMGKGYNNTAGSLMRSKNGGINWDNMGTFTNGSRGIQTIALDPTNEQHLFWSSGGDVYESTDEGSTNVKRVTKPFASRTATQADCTNAGGTWSTANANCTVGIRFLHFDQANNVLLIGAGSTNTALTNLLGMVIYNLDDDTQSYIDLTGTGGKRNLWFDTYTDGGTNYFCTTAGLKIGCSSDYTSWNYTATNITGLSGYFIEHFVIHKTTAGDTRIIADARSSSSPYVRLQSRSLDFGTSWASITERRASQSINPTNLWAASVGRNFFQISEDVLDEDNIAYVSDWRVFISKDGGQNFYEQVQGAENVVVNDVDISPTGVYFAVAMDTGIVRKERNATSWTSVFPNATYGYNTWGGHTWRVKCIGKKRQWLEGKGIVVATHTTYTSSKYYWNYVLYSEDNGITFTPVLLVDKDLYNGVWGNGYARGLAVSDDGKTVYVTVDGDNCQYNASLPATCPTSGNPKPSNYITGGMFISRNSGKTFARTNGDPLITTNYNLRRTFFALAVDPTVSSGNTVLWGNYNTNSWRSTDAVATDTEGVSLNYTSSTNYVVNMIYKKNSRPLIVGVEGSSPVLYGSIQTVYGNANGAWGTWSKFKTFSNTGLASGIDVDPKRPNRAVVSTVENTSLKGNRKVWMTFDLDKLASATWTDVTGDLPVGGCRNIKFDLDDGPNGSVVCASPGAGILKKDLADSKPITTPNVRYIGGYK